MATAASSARPDYALPTGVVVPRMQTAGEAPVFADAAARYPLLAFSHGYGGSPLSGDELLALSTFASYGYVVVAPFHGDRRFSDLKVDDLSDAIAVLRRFNDLIALQALRPLSVSAAIDLMLASPQWRDHVDPARIGEAAHRRAQALGVGLIALLVVARRRLFHRQPRGGGIQLERLLLGHDGTPLRVKAYPVSAFDGPQKKACISLPNGNHTRSS